MTCWAGSAATATTPASDGVTTMTNPPDNDGSHASHVEPLPGVVLVCEGCDHVWELSPAELGVGPVLCTQCDGWTMIAELATTAEQTSPAELPASTGKRRAP